VGEVNDDLARRDFWFNRNEFRLEHSMAESVFLLITLMLEHNFFFRLYLLQKLSQ